MDVPPRSHGDAERGSTAHEGGAVFLIFGDGQILDRLDDGGSEDLAIDASLELRVLRLDETRDAFGDSGEEVAVGIARLHSLQCAQQVVRETPVPLVEHDLERLLVVAAPRDEDVRVGEGEPPAPPCVRAREGRRAKPRRIRLRR
jgi:hypothetical protein